MPALIAASTTCGADPRHDARAAFANAVRLLSLRSKRGSPAMKWGTDHRAIQGVSGAARHHEAVRPTKVKAAASGCAHPFVQPDT